MPSDPTTEPEYLKLNKPVIILTVPKSGTHLITNIMRELFGSAQIDPTMMSGNKIPPDVASRQLIYHTHIRYSVDASVALRDVTKVLLVRDPRDLAASYMRSIYSRKISPDPAQKYLLENNFGPDEVLSFIIQGGHAGGISYPDIGTFYRQYFWSWHVSTDLVVRYEELLPDGDDFSAAAAQVKALLQRLEIDLPADFPLLERVRAGSQPGRSATFDRGRSGSWQTDFAPIHHVLLNLVAPTLLSDLGYVPSAHAASTQIFEPVTALTTRSSTGESNDFGGEPLRAGTDAIARRELTRIDAILKRIKSLDDHVPHRTSILNFAGLNLWLFVWADDAIERAHRGNQGLNLHLEAARARTGAPKVELPSGFWSPVEEACRAAIAQYGNVRYVEIGCSYGLETMMVAALLDDCADRLSITAFDCGLAGRLAPASFDLNGLASRIEFRSEAVTAWDAPTLVFGTYGNMENMRIVNNSVSRDTVSYPVAGVRLDTAYRDLQDEMLVLKLHIQGAEFLTLQGAKRLLRNNRVAAIIVAFAPHALASTDVPENLPNYLSADWLIYDIGRNHTVVKDRPRYISRERFADFANNVANAQVPYTFLLLHSPELSVSASDYLAHSLNPGHLTTESNSQDSAQM